MFVVTPAPTVDPRQPPRSAHAAVATVADADDAERLAEWWAPRVAELTSGRRGGRAAARAGRLADSGRRALSWPACANWFSTLSCSPGRRVLPGTAWRACRRAWSITSPARCRGGTGRPTGFGGNSSLLRRIAPVIAPMGEHQRPMAALLADGWMRRLPDETEGAEVKRLNALRTQPAFGAGPARLLSGAGQAVTALLRTDAADPRQARQAALLLLNSDAAPAVASGASGAAGRRVVRAVAVRVVGRGVRCRIDVAAAAWRPDGVHGPCPAAAQPAGQPAAGQRRRAGGPPSAPGHRGPLALRRWRPVPVPAHRGRPRRGRGRHHRRWPRQAGRHAALARSRRDGLA